METVVKGKQSCPTCGQSVNYREISVILNLVTAIERVYDWCEKRGKWEFTREDIKPLFSDNYALATRFADWKYFGEPFLLKNEKRSHFHLSRERTRLFLAGVLPIPLRIIKNPFTGEITVIKRGTVRDVASQSGEVFDNGAFVARYRGGNGSK